MPSSGSPIEHGAWIVADEIYRGAELDGDDTTPTFWGRYERVVVTSGLSKAFAMPGSAGGLGGCPDGHDRPHLGASRLHDADAGHGFGSACGTGDVPEVREQILARTRSIVRANYPRLEAWLASHADTFEWVRPTAGAIAFAQVNLPGSTSRAGRADSDRAERAAGVGRDVRDRQRHPIRLRLRHRPHPEGSAKVDECSLTVEVAKVVDSPRNRGH